MYNILNIVTIIVLLFIPVPTILDIYRYSITYLNCRGDMIEVHTQY